MRTPLRTGLLAATLALGLSACALRSADVRPISADPREFDNWNCARLAAEMDQVQRRAARVAYAFDERAGDNIIAMGLGLAVFWPAMLAMRSPGPQAQELGELKGRHEALREAHRARDCAAQVSGTPAPASVSLQDRFTYEWRESPKAVVQRATLELSAIAGDRLEWQPRDGAEKSARWVNDRLGNLLQSGGSGLVWPQLLRAELALGELVHGELVDAADPNRRARVRGQVVAVGPQEVAGRRFEVAVIDIYGDAPVGETRARLDGVLVVDRGSGVLLRLDLDSSSPGFRVQRRLVRVERPQP